MRLPLSIAGALIAASAVTGAAIAQTSPSNAPPVQSQGGQHLSRLDRLAILLDLTDTQKLQVQQVLQEQRQQMRTQWQQLKSSGTKPDFRQMRAAHQQLRQQTLAKLQTLLSADQYRKFQVLMTMGRRGRWHRGPPGGPPPAGSPPTDGSGSSSSAG
ncbi:MAG: hypothetical protein ACREUG_09675 [Steroidobacteraceae bacterium]